MNGYKLWITVACGLLLATALPARAEMEPAESTGQLATEASVAVGYRGVSVHGEPARAREYDSLQSSPLFDTRLFVDRGGYHLDLGVDYLNDNDYSANVNLNTKGLLRLDLRSERFFHNLDHIPYDNGSRGVPVNDSTPRPQPFPAVEGSRPDGWFANSTSALRTYYTDQNPGDDYGLRLDMNEAKLKIKCPDYPAHLNLSYWRYEKQGDKQHRFLSEGGIQGAIGAGEGNCVGCHMESKSRDIDRVTEEFKASVDAHAGFVDVVLETLYRTFRDREEIPGDIFGVHDRGRAYGNYEHSEDPDSNLKEVTLRLNSAPSGGLVGAASFTIGERENRSDLTSVAPVDAETDYYKTTADVTYTPSQNWTFNLRYRLLDLDSDNNAVITQYGSTRILPLNVRESLDISRAWYEAVANYRPSPHLTLKAEFRREEIKRDGTAPIIGHSTPGDLALPVIINPNWKLPDEEIITRVKFGFTSRLLEKSAIKLSGWLAIQKNDDPAYGTSYGESQELFLGGSYAPSPLWGLQGNINLLKQENDDFQIDGESIDRRKEQQTISFGTWMNPRENLSFDLYYGYFRTNIDQTMFYGGTPPYAISDDGADYQQTVQTLTAGMTWQALADLSCRVEGYHVRSKASYDPDFPTANFNYGNANPPNVPGIASSADLHDISKVDIAQNGLKGRVDWKLSENLTCGVEATFDDYDEKGNDVYDGSVQSYMASLTYTF